ncbi:MAG TPA: ABC transporter permease [Rectinemataceae bacterium]|nr:ABC transporter permease [Rectinemataceae bacterium]
MYRKYVLKRVVYGILMYMVMIFIYSTLFNNVADKTTRAQIDEQVAQEIHRYKNLSPAQITTLLQTLKQNKIRQYHLDEPLASRIFWRSVRTITFDFGNSTIIRSSTGDRNVIKIILEALPRTIILFTTNILIVTLIGIYMGMYAARKPNGGLDRVNSMLTMITNGLPAWWLAMLAIMLFSYSIPIFPSGGLHVNPAPTGFKGVLDYLWHLSLPLLTLVILSIWSTAYLVRNIVLSNLQEDFVMAARARGISERKVLFGHTLRTSMPAIMTMAILGLFGSIAGNIIVEGIFGWPGIGNLYFIAVQQNDVPVLMATLAIETLFTMVGFIILDILYGLLDPRIKVGGKA